MSTLHSINLVGEAVQTGRSVSTGDFLVNGHDSSYIMSPKKAVFTVPTLGPRSTNM